MTDRNDQTIRTRGEAQDARLRMGPDSWDEETRTLDLVWSTGADVARADPWSSKRYVERLSMDPAHIRAERLNAGAPLLDTHRSHGAANVVGNVVPGSVVIADGIGRARVRLTDADDVASTVRKITDGSIRNISVGYRTHREEVDANDGEIEIRTATDWEPYEISVVPVPADAGAQVRELERNDPQETKLMSQIETPAPAVNLDDVRATAAKSERKRAANIRSACVALGLADEAQSFIDSGADINATRAALIGKRAELDAATATDNHIRVGASHGDKLRAGIENAIMHRTGLVSDLTDAGRAHRHMTLVDMARATFAAKGVDVTRMSNRDVATLAMQPQRGLSLSRDYDGNIRALGGHSTSDFPLLLANVGNKFLLPGYQSEELNFLPFVTDRNLPDFKQASVVNLGRINSMPKKVEGAEYQHVTIGESNEVYSLATYGSTIGFTREMMINDDLGGFEIAIREMGAVWARTQLDLFWSIFSDNANMGDGNALFSAAHGNLGTGGAMSKALLAEMRQLLREQRGVESSAGAADGQFLNLMPAHLIVPTDLEQTAEDLMGANYDPTTAANARPGWLGPLTLTVEPRLGVASATAYYLAASRAFAERGLLGGSDAPYIDSMDEWSTDQMNFKIRGDVAFKATDWRPVTANAGA